MSNEDGKIAIATVNHFAQKSTTIPTAEQKLQVLQKRKEVGKGTKIKEANSIKDLTVMLAKEGVTLVDLTREVEGGKADGYMMPSGQQGDEFVGVQLTQATRAKNNSFTINKSKQKIVKAVLNYQFVCVCQLYVAEEFCGAVVLTPEDSSIIESLPNSGHFGFYAIGRTKQVIKAGSVYEKLLPKIFVWKNDEQLYDKQEAKRFVQHISKFLSVASTKYSKEEFAIMLSDTSMIEHKYILSFKTIFVDADRMPVGQRGDLHFKINGVQVGAELRMMCLHPGRGYRVEVYKSRHELAEIVNSISMFVFVFSGNVEVPHASKNPADYSQFICIPTRTADGQANICDRHVKGKQTIMRLRFDPGTGVVSNAPDSVNRVRDEKDYLVLTTGGIVSASSKAKLEEWARRPKVQAAAIPITSAVKRTVVESSSDDDEPITAPRRRRIMIHDSDSD
jgi:hypothetical protein